MWRAPCEAPQSDLEARFAMLSVFARIIVAAALALSFVAEARPAFSQTPQTIEKLLQDGWEVAGYVAAWENRTLILFRHKDRPFLVQCSVLVDVQRNPRTVVACYELR
jgi:hypothetical protein